MKNPNISPSLLLFAPILPIKPFTPGIWLAAPVIRRLMLANVSLCTPKLSWMAYAWLSTLSAMLLLLSILLLSSSMYSASAADALWEEDRYASMSERTLERRFARLRASAMLARNRESSRRWSARISRWRERLFCLRAEEVRVDSESRRRES